MQTLRQSRALARFVLVWLLLALGSAMASPLLKPHQLATVCTAAGMVEIALDADPGEGGSSMPSSQGQTLDCPLCFPSGIATWSIEAAWPPLKPVASWTMVRLPEPIALRSATPWPPRGPPTSL